MLTIYLGYPDTISTTSIAKRALDAVTSTYSKIRYCGDYALRGIVLADHIKTLPKSSKFCKGTPDHTQIRLTAPDEDSLQSVATDGVKSTYLFTTHRG